MNKKTENHKKSTHFILINLGIAAVLIIIGLITLVSYLRTYTRHGVEVEVPSVIGMYLEVAAPVLEAEQLHPVVIDSTYSSKVPLGTIVEQNPPAGSHAKPDRAIYLIVNAREKRQVVLPDLRDVSFRQAITTLRQMQIGVADTLYEPSEFKDLILDVRLGEESIEPGQKLTEGSRVTLVVGYGRGTEEVMVPNLIGLTLRDARSLLLASALTLGTVEYDEELTEETRDQFRVISQHPQSDRMLLQGERVDVHLSTDMEKAANNASSSEEDFF